MNGIKLVGTLKQFDQFTLLQGPDGIESMVYKQAISTLQPGTARPPTCGSNHFWLSPAGWQCWGCTEPEPRAITLHLPTSQPTPDTAGNIPYRLNVGNVTRLVWLPPGLPPADVLTRAKARYPDLEVTDQPPAHGWPRLQDIPSIPATRHQEGA